jgi:uncharacterized protein
LDITGIKRNLSKKIIRLLELFPVVAILGARQTGKTHLTKMLFPDWKYIDLENNNDFEQITYDPLFFFQQYPNNTIIDEAQLFPPIFKTLRGVIDDNRQQKGRYLITGSSSPELLQNISESLAGRVAIVQLGTLKANEYYQKPLSNFYKIFSETLTSESLTKDKFPISGAPPITNKQMQHIWLNGGYAEPLLSDEKDFYNLWMENYKKTYIQRDIAQLFPRLDKIKFQRFITMLGKLSGTIINKKNIATVIETSEPTIKEYIDIADGTFIWKKLSSYEENITKSITKMPKGHIRDNGLLHSILKIPNYDSLLNDPMVGQSFESFVIEEILKGLEATLTTNWDAHYYRTRNGAEIDLILRGEFGVLPIEIKHGSTIKMKQLQSLTSFVKEHDLPLGILINQTNEVKWITPNIINIPFGWL